MITYIIIAGTALFSIQAFQKHDLFLKHTFNPYIVNRNREWHRFFTHALLHADWTHLLVNMLVLYFFGPTVEKAYQMNFGLVGSLYFVLLYVGSVVVSIYPTFEKHRNNPGYNSVGASGAVSAVVFASILFHPERNICLWGILCLPAILWSVLYLVYSWQMGKRGRDNINHSAHFFGAVFGILFTILLDTDIAVRFYQTIRFLYF
ncbi:MAG: rhomboid family intramembrane serine protease [Flavobacteriales bacterium]|nr:rhomboid family intramembrane serine protease [Flavobacteriales bacterium]